MELNEILKWLVLGASGGGGIGLLNWLLRKQNADVKTFETLRDSYTKEFERLENKVDNLISETASLKQELKLKDAELSVLRAQMDNMKKAYPDLPIPLWLKDRNGIMLSLNDAYEKAFLIPQGKHRGDYIMQPDTAIWPTEVAELFKKNDIKAIEKEGSTRIVFEDIPEMKLLRNWQFLKYPYFIDGTLVGIGGIAIPQETLKV